MSLDLTPVHRNLHTQVTFLGLELEDLILVLALAALMNLLAHFVSDTASLRATWSWTDPSRQIATDPVIALLDYFCIAYDPEVES